MIEVSHLTKRYGGHCAVDDLNFTVENGVIYGFLGPNGAGKSTTMNIITGCLAATEGKVDIDGYDIFDDPKEAKRRIGYLPEVPPLYTDMTPAEYLTFVARAKSVPAGKIEEQLKRVVSVTGLEDVLDRLIRNLSKGYRQRVGIAQALLGDPEIIILDEPTVGLDPLQIIEIRDLIKSLGKTHTVILSSHILSEVQAICDQVLVINKGKLVACDTPQNLEKLFAEATTYELTVKASAIAVKDTLEKLEGIESINITAQEDDRCDVTVITTANAGKMDEKLSFALSDARLPVLRLEQKKTNLEDAFIGLTTGDGKPQGGKKKNVETPDDGQKQGKGGDPA